MFSLCDSALCYYIEDICSVLDGRSTYADISDMKEPCDDGRSMKGLDEAVGDLFGLKSEVFRIFEGKCTHKDKKTKKLFSSEQQETLFLLRNSALKIKEMNDVWNGVFDCIDLMRTDPLKSALADEMICLFIRLMKSIRSGDRKKLKRILNEIKIKLETETETEEEAARKKEIEKKGEDRRGRLPHENKKDTAVANLENEETEEDEIPSKKIRRRRVRAEQEIRAADSGRIKENTEPQLETNEQLKRNNLDLLNSLMMAIPKIQYSSMDEIEDFINKIRKYRNINRKQTARSSKDRFIIEMSEDEEDADRTTKKDKNENITDRLSTQYLALKDRISQNKNKCVAVSVISIFVTVCAVVNVINAVQKQRILS
ncbi:hypothetical protein NEMIN01_1867 [Nematocida minor]|uniref:uncharacterized protein n=1 Tax=Nematocida minor TaxID=1912983 RepID=UPI00221FCCAA|nr:uncharacterized protein NEMIN01_1867 [Nematocida minor]KAI5192198.1 hypothetical protein NEMIN01_1867 [Nematocida minor]